MNRLRPKIVIEDYKNRFDYKKKDTNLNIEFNRVSFIFFFFFIIYLIYTIHLIHLGSRKSNVEMKEILPTFSNKLYRADIIDIYFLQLDTKLPYAYGTLCWRLLGHC